MAGLDRERNIAHLRERARRRLPHGLFEFVDRGCEDDQSMDGNLQAFRRIGLRPRVLVDVSARSLQCELLGVPSAMPMAVAPTGVAGLLWHDGEVALARAARTAGIPFTLSTGSLASIERVASEAGGRLWFQLYLWPELEMSFELVRRAQDAGFEALVVTVDTPLVPNREYNNVNGFSVPFSLQPRNMLDIASSPRWLFGVLARYLVRGGLPHFVNFPQALRRPMLGGGWGKNMLPLTDSIGWDHLRQLRRLWRGPLLVKGILRADDAALAVQHGADGVIVSNHGGRNLDTSIAPIDALPAVAACVGDRASVLLDSGIRRGTDVAKALALGAQGVLLGRAPLWGLACGGEAGVTHALDLLRAELDRTLGFLGCTGPGDLHPDLLQRQGIAADARPGDDGSRCARPDVMARV